METITQNAPELDDIDLEQLQDTYYRNGTTNMSSGDVNSIGRLSHIYMPCMAYALHDDYQGVMASTHLFIYVSLLSVLVGIVGNALSMRVFLSPEMRTISSNIYLLVLSVSDTGYLISVFFAKILTNLRCMFFNSSTVDLENQSQAACKVLQLLMDLFANYSSCLILAFTLERFFACYYALKFRENKSTLRARIFSTAMLFVIALSISPYHLIYVGLEDGHCRILRGSENIAMALYYIEAFIYRIIPVLIVAVLNIFISIKVCKLHRNRTSHKTQSHELRELTSSKEPQKKKGRKMNNSNDERHVQITVMLLVVSTTYIVLYFPVLIHFALAKVLQHRESIDVIQKMIVFENVVRTLYISGFAINFFLYTVSCKSFRDQLVFVFTNKHTYSDVSTRVGVTGNSAANARNGSDHGNHGTTSQTHL